MLAQSKGSKSVNFHDDDGSGVHGVSLGAAGGLERDFHSILVDGLNFVFPRYIS